jgi:hypothetical protein
VAIALAAVAAVVPTAAAAKRNKKIFKAVVDGRRLKPTPRTVGLETGGGTIGLLVTGTKSGGARGVSKSVLVTCVNDLGLQRFPFTTTDCLANYTETRPRPLSIRIWQTLQIGATEVTVDTYDGVSIAGRFHAVLPPGPSNPALPPVTVDGEFRGPVRVGDPTR